MSFNRTTSSTNTGLGDDQYAQLQSNQGTIGTQVQEGFGGVGTRLDAVDTGITGLQSDIGGVATNVNANTNTGFTNLGETLSGYNDANNLRFDQFGRSVTENAAAVGANNTALNNLQGDVTVGFNDQDTRFNQVDAANTAMQGDITSGFDDTRQGFVDAQTDRTTNAGAVEQGFVDAGAALVQGFGDAEAQVGQAATDVLAGQTEAASNLDALNTGFNAYAAQDASDQAAMKATQDGFVSDFDAYTDRYTEDTTLANQTRTDIELANTNAANQIRQDIGAFANASASGQDLISSQVNSVEDTVDGGFINANAQQAAATQAVQAAAAQNAAAAQTTTNNAATDLQNALASGIETLDSGQITAARDMAKVAASQTDLDIGMRQNFNQLGNAFDDTGTLIESSIDKQGNTITRKMDDQGNLILDQFDVTGKILGQKVINVNNTLSELGNLRNVQGANISMGNLTPASSVGVPQSGFASPFTTTT